MRQIKKIIKEITYQCIPNSAVLALHHVNEKGFLCSGCVLDYESFCCFVDEFHNYATLDDVLKNPNKRQIAITFDDGLEDLYTHVYPLLGNKNIPFTAFIVPDFIGKKGYLTSCQIKELASDPLVTIGSHGLTHKVFTSMSEDEIKLEAERSKVLLQDLTDQKISMIAYSHGQVNQTVVNNLNNYYEYGLSVNAEPINWVTRRNKYRLPRFNVENDTVEEISTRIKRLVNL